jgi:ketosteroid isomerase-like protein
MNGAVGPDVTDAGCSATDKGSQRIMSTRAANLISLMRQVLLAVVAAASMVPGATHAARMVGDATMPPALAEALSEYRQATMRNDIAALSKLVAEDYVLVNSDASLQAKPSYLADFKRPGFKIERYVVEQPAHAMWGDTALVRGLLHLTWTQDGERHERVVRIAHVWSRHAGRWQLAYTQLTRVPDR